MKKFGLLLSFLLLTTQLSWGQTTINFDNAANWIQDGTVALSSYGNHAYAESGVTIQGTNVLRNTTSVQDLFPGALGTYSMRIGNTVVSKVTITVATGGVSTFSIKVRRWDASPIPNYTVKTSVDGGSYWTSLTNIDGTLLTTSDFFTYNGTINSAVDNILIEIANTGTTERIMIDDFTWTGYAGSSPTVSVNPSSLSGFTYVEGSGPSTSQSYNLSGNNLDGSDVTITAPTDYEISLDDANWFSSRTLSAFDGTNTPIYVRLKAGLSAAAYNGETISNSGGGATTQNVTCSGSVTPSSILSVTPATLTGFTYAFGSGPSTSQTYDLSGSDLTGYPGNITVTGSDSYEVSTDNTNFSGSVNVAYTSSTLASTPIYVRLKADLGIASYSGEIISNAGGGAITQNVSVSGNVTAPLSSLPMVENFDYTSGSNLAGQGFWQNIGTNGTDLLVSSSELTYTNYPALGGFSAEITSSRSDDLGKGFVAQSSGSLYYSFLVKVTGTSGAGTYFTSLNTAPTATYYTGRVYAKIVESNVNFGLSKSSETAIYSSSNYVIGTTYLLVLKYNFVDGDSNDAVSLFIFTDPTIPIAEPVTAEIGPLVPANADNSSLSGVLLRQATGVPNLLLDGIVIANDWVEALLPVELTSFSAATIGSKIKLNWNTATEINNYGFEIQKSGVGSQKTEWSAIGFVNGNGNSNSPKNYSFVDDNVTAGKYSYRLKQIDNDGQFEYSKTVEVNFGAPKKFELSQNYPNPFNPTTTISYNIPEATNVKLTIFNILGQEIETLVNEFNEAGIHTVNFNASELNSGLYIYKLQAGTFVQTRKMTLIK